MGVQTKEVHQYQIIIQTQVMRQRPWQKKEYTSNFF